MMQPIDYHCKICGTGRVAYFDDSCPINKLETWKKVLTCPRCYTFRDSYTRAKNSIIDVCYALNNFRESSRHSEEKRSALRQVESKIKDRIIAHTRRISSLCSDYYRIQNTWDIDFVYQILERPMHSLRTIDAYHAGIRKLSREAQPKQVELQEMN